METNVSGHIYVLRRNLKNEMKKALRGAQTLRAGCRKAEPQIFAPPQTHSRGRGTTKI